MGSNDHVDEPTLPERLHALVRRWRLSAKQGTALIPQGKSDEYPSLMAASQQLSECADQLEKALK